MAPSVAHGERSRQDPARPPEFEPERVRQDSPREEQLFASFLRSGEPFKSLHANNPCLAADLSKPLEFGRRPEPWFYDTTVARKHPYWRQFVGDLPAPTKDISRIRRDVRKWGYALLQDGLSQAQLAAMRARVTQQAEAEAAAGLGVWISRENQMVYALVNKGRCFEGCIEQDLQHVQGGAVLEQVFTEALGSGWIANSFQAIIAHPGGVPQSLHQDQGAAHPFQTAEAPLLFNSLWMLDDVDDSNGGTLVVPGSHATLAAAGSGRPVAEKLPPAINLEAPAGTIMLFDGRLLHGTGVNRSDRPRHVLVFSGIKPWMRSQDFWALVVRREVLERASDKLLHRLGFQAINFGVCEGQGILGSGRAGDPKGDVLPFRRAMDEGTYMRVGELRPEEVEEARRRPYTLRGTSAGKPAMARATRNAYLRQASKL